MSDWLAMTLIVCFGLFCAASIGVGIHRSLDRPVAIKQVKLRDPVKYDTVVIEGCHYLVTRQHMGAVALCHKGNCPNH